MLGENLQIVRENIAIFIKASKDNGLEVNTKYKITSRELGVLQNQSRPITVGTLSFENVEKFK